MLVLDNYTLEYSAKRKTSVSISFGDNGHITVKAPINFTTDTINSILEKNVARLWHLKQKNKHKIYLTADMFNTDFKKFEAINLLKKRFETIAKQAKKFNLITSKAVKFSLMKSRWGACKSTGQISLNLFLGLLPQHLIDAVIAHEFCHLAEMNHSQRFYNLLSKLYPQYKECDIELKQYILKK